MKAIQMTAFMTTMCLLLLSNGKLTSAQDAYESSGHVLEPVIQEIEGWTVHVDPALLEGEYAEEGEQALKMLAGHLQRIAILVPEPQLTDMRGLEIWIERRHPELLLQGLLCRVVAEFPRRSGGRDHGARGGESRQICVLTDEALGWFDAGEFIQ